MPEVTKTEIKTLIMTNQRWVERAILAIFRKQTEREQSTEDTIDRNGVGFTAYDARKLSYYAKWILSGRHLSGKFLQDAFKKTGKYAGQLEKISKGEI